MAVSVEQFIERLSASGLLSADDVSAITEELGSDQQPEDAESLASILLEQKKLTEYQVEALKAGQTQGLAFGEYTVLEKIGAGGMGEVLKARHRTMKRLVAIKVVPKKLLESQDAINRFHREVEAAAKLSHPNVVTAFDAGEQQGLHYLVMEFVEGQDLSELVAAKGPFSIEHAVECIRQTALGLAYAHEEGVVHRDIKPANLLLSKKGRVKILDMGLARITGDDAAVAGLTQTGQVMGTVDYMAPEQAQSTQRADERSDIYSLGCTFYRLLTGKPVYEGESLMNKMMSHMADPIPSMLTHRADIPEAIDAVYQRMVAKAPDDRYQTMEEVIAALDAATAGRATPPPRNPSFSDTDLTFNLQDASAPSIQTKPKLTAGGEETIDRAPPTEDTATRHPQSVTLDSDSEATSQFEIDSEPTSQFDASQPSFEGVPATTVSPTQRAVRTSRKTGLSRGKVIAIGGSTAGVLALAAIIWAITSGDPELDSPAETDSKVAGDATVKQVSKKPSAKAPPLAIAPFNEDEAKAHQRAWANRLGLPVEKEVTLPGGATMKFMLIPPGEFLMGSTDKEQAKFLSEAPEGKEEFLRKRIPSEGPQHRVKIARPFYFGKYEVTQAQWQSVIQSNPSIHPGADRPVDNVSWSDIQIFLQRMHSVDAPSGSKYSLPTEAQWEYACRAGSTSYWFFGDNESELGEYAWFVANSNNTTHPVGQKKPNPWGLYDIHGNVREECEDWFGESYYSKSPDTDPTGPSSGQGRVDRGGIAFNHATFCRSADRGHAPPSQRGERRGFRLAMSIKVEELKGDRPTANYALQFDGKSSSVDIPSLMFDGSHPLTIEAYVTPDRSDADVNIIGDHHGRGVTLKIKAQTWMFVAGPNKSTLKAIDRAPFSPGKRVHLAGTWNQDELRLFVDGKLVSTTPFTRPKYDVSKENFAIGAYPWGKYNGCFAGTIDEARISSVARYDADFKPQRRFEPDSDTLALYHFDEGSGDTLKDSSGNNHHGKIVGAKWVPIGDGSQPDPPVYAGTNYAMQFTPVEEGNSPHVIRVPTLEDQTPSLTIETWYRNTDQTGHHQLPSHAFLVGFEKINRLGGSAAGGYEYRVGRSAGDQRALVGVAVNLADRMKNRGTVHLAGVRDASRDEVRFYVNGSLVGRRRLDGAKSSGAFHFGSEHPQHGHFGGWIDETRISSVARYDADFIPAKRFEPDRHTLALYHFDEGQGDELKDSSGNNHHGKITGAKWVRVASTDTDAPRAAENETTGSLRFAHSNEVNFPTLTDDGEPFTIEVDFTRTGMHGNYGVVFGFVGKEGTEAPQLGFKGTSVSASAAVSPSVTTNAVLVKENQRTRIAVVRDRDELRMYVNGTAHPPVSIAGKQWIKGGRLRLGRYIGTLIGDIHQMRVSNGVRYTKDYVPPRRFTKDAQTRALFTFEEGQGNVLTDSSGNNHHGKIVGAKWLRIGGGEDSPKPNAKDVDREVAEWILSRGGTVTTNVSEASTELPNGAFKVTGVGFSRKFNPPNPQEMLRLKSLTELWSLSFRRVGFSDAQLAALASFTDLTTLITESASFTDDGLAPLENLTKLEELSLAKARIGDKGLAHLQALTNLRRLNLGYTQVTSDGLKHLAGMKNLQHLGLGSKTRSLEPLAGLTNMRTLYLKSTRVTSAELVHLKGMTKLEELALSGAPVSDSGLTHLTGLKSLRQVWTDGCLVTPAGLEELQAALPNCKVENLELVREMFQGTAARQRAAAQWVIEAGGRVATDKGVLTPASKLPADEFTLVAIDLKNNAKVTDTDLHRFLGLAKLTQLRVSGTQVTAEVAAAFQEAMPSCKVLLK